jgi:hypothetical protein
MREWRSASRPGRIVLNIHGGGGKVGPKASLDAVQERKLNPAVEAVTCRYTD